MEYIGAKKILEKKREYIMPCLGHFYSDPPQFVRGEMQYLFDTTGKKYLDCYAGVSVINCGHCNPFITERMIKQIKTLQHVCNIYLTENFVNLAERLAQVTPGDLQKCFFCSTGTEANEGSLMLASIYTKSSEFIALQSGLHGRTKLTLSLTGIGMWRTDPNPVGGINFAPNPYCYRCPLNRKYPECDLECANRIETIIQSSTSGRPAALIAEPIQGNAGIVVPPKNYFKRVKEILAKYGALLIADEVQTGFARTGKMFAIENFDVTPDIMSVAKALGNGQPISAFIATKQIADTYTRPGASTLGGNPVSSTAGLAVLKAKDGIYAILGNHDYAEYVGCDEAMKIANCRETVSLERQMGWTVLLNEHRIINRDSSHIVIAGMENDGNNKKFPQKGDIPKTLEGADSYPN